MSIAWNCATNMIEALFDLSNYQTAAKLMDVAKLNHTLTAGNIANVDTPGYTRLQVAPTFQAELKRAIESGDTDAIRNLQVRVEEDRLSEAVRPDGNNVNLDREMVNLSKNSLQYDYLVRVVNGQFSSFRQAITGQSR